MGKLITQVGLGWLGRRIPEWGGVLTGVVGFIIALYSNLDPEDQRSLTTAIQQFFTGQWKEITLGHVATLIGIVAFAWGQRKSFKATVEPQIVTPAGNKTAKDVAAAQNPAAVNSAIRAADNAAAEAKITPRDRPLLKGLRWLIGK